jgi:hypothetical protein
MYPTRLRHFLYGCGLHAIENETRLAGAKGSQRAAKAIGVAR